MLRIVLVLAVLACCGCLFDQEMQDPAAAQIPVYMMEGHEIGCSPGALSLVEIEDHPISAETLPLAVAGSFGPSPRFVYGGLTTVGDVTHLSLGVFSATGNFVARADTTVDGRLVSSMIYRDLRQVRVVLLMEDARYLCTYDAGAEAAGINCSSNSGVLNQYTTGLDDPISSASAEVVVPDNVTAFDRYNALVAVEGSIPGGSGVRVTNVRRTQAVFDVQSSSPHRYHSMLVANRLQAVDFDGGQAYVPDLVFLEPGEFGPLATRWVWDGGAMEYQRNRTWAYWPDLRDGNQSFTFISSTSQSGTRVGWLGVSRSSGNVFLSQPGGFSDGSEFARASGLGFVDRIRHADSERAIFSISPASGNARLVEWQMDSNEYRTAEVSGPEGSRVHNAYLFARQESFLTAIVETDGGWRVGVRRLNPLEGGLEDLCP